MKEGKGHQSMGECYLTVTGSAMGRRDTAMSIQPAAAAANGEMGSRINARLDDVNGRQDG